MAATEPGTGTEEQNATPPPEQTGALPNTQDAVRRADAILSDVGTRLGHWTARLQRDAARLAARTREELEDMWVEAQALRRRENRASPAATSTAPGEESGQPITAETRDGGRDEAH